MQKMGLKNAGLGEAIRTSARETLKETIEKCNSEKKKWEMEKNAKNNLQIRPETN